MPPTPQPTTYNGVTYRSKLEATWAVFLHWNRCVDQFSYEPTKVKMKNTENRYHGSTYTPDFLVKIADMHFFLEVKPAKPTEQYLFRCTNFQPLLRQPLYVAYGTFFNSSPKIMTLTGTPIGLAQMFPDAAYSVTAVQNYRWDLPEQSPDFRSETNETKELHSKWLRAQRQKNLDQRMKRYRHGR